MIVFHYIEPCHHLHPLFHCLFSGEATLGNENSQVIKVTVNNDSDKLGLSCAKLRPAYLVYPSYDYKKIEQIVFVLERSQIAQ